VNTTYTYLLLEPDLASQTWDRIPQVPEDLTWTPWWVHLKLDLPHCTHVQLTAYPMVFHSGVTLRHPEAFEQTSDAFRLHPGDHATLLRLYHRHQTNLMVTATWEFL
jgi:hypothetical protein